MRLVQPAYNSECKHRLRFDGTTPWAWLIALICALSSSALAGRASIDLSFDAEGSNCSRSVSAGVPFEFYIQARTAGAAAGGITGADFRVDGIPAAWLPFVSWVANPPGATTLGDPVFTAIPVLRGQAILNGPPCSLALETRTWSEVEATHE
jgi:hypothetical protein